MHDLLVALFKDFELHRQSCFEVYQLDAPSLEV